MRTVTTVCGEFPADQLGVTSMHEHLNADFPALTAHSGVSFPPEILALELENMAFLRDAGYAFSTEAVTLGDVDYTRTELGYFHRAGGRAIVDATPIGARGDVRDLRAASEGAGVHVLFATGLYVSGSRPSGYVELTQEQQYAAFSAEVEEGVGSTGLRPGILKCALSCAAPTDRLRPDEVATLSALARVSAASGLSLQVHTAFPMSVEQVTTAVEIALSAGMPADKLVMIHMDSFLRPWDAVDRYLNDPDETLTVSNRTARAVLEYGVNIGFDSWGTTVSVLPSDLDRVKGLVELLRDGWGPRIVLGHDNATKPHGRSYGGYGFTRFGSFLPPMLAKAGFADDVYTTLVVDNPARILAR